RRLAPPQLRIRSRQPYRRRHADARVALAEARVVLAPEPAPAGVDDHRIAGLQAHALPLQRLLQILDGDLVRVAEHVDTLQSGHVDEHPARHQRADVFDAELGEARARGDVVSLVAVVVAGFRRLLGEALELGADLADLAREPPFV